MNYFKVGKNLGYDKTIILNFIWWTTLAWFVWIVSAPMVNLLETITLYCFCPWTLFYFQNPLAYLYLCHNLDLPFINKPSPKLPPPSSTPWRCYTCCKKQKKDNPMWLFPSWNSLHLIISFFKVIAFLPIQTPK